MTENNFQEINFQENLRRSQYGVIYLEKNNTVKSVPYETDQILGSLQAGVSDFWLNLATHIGSQWNLPFKARISWEESEWGGEKRFTIRTALKSKETTTEEFYSLLAGPIREICELKGYDRIFTITKLPQEHMKKLGWTPAWDKGIMGYNKYYTLTESLKHFGSKS